MRAVNLLFPPTPEKKGRDISLHKAKQSNTVQHGRRSIILTSMSKDERVKSLYVGGNVLGMSISPAMTHANVAHRIHPGGFFISPVQRALFH